MKKHNKLFKAVFLSSIALGIIFKPVPVNAEAQAQGEYQLKLSDKSKISTLSNLTVSQGTLSPAFNPEITFYTLKMDAGVDRLTVTPTVTDTGKALAAVNGEEVDDGQPSPEILLNNEYDWIQIDVAAENGLYHTTYTIMLDTEAKVFGWQEDERGWYYINPDGSRPSNKWLWDEYAWYRLDKDGYRQTGWIFDKDYNNWYFLDERGMMRTGYFYDKDYKSYFYLKDNGAMATGWAYISDKIKGWGYFRANGTAVTGWMFDKSDKHWYLLDGQGIMATGWIREMDGTVYYCKENGIMVTGWYFNKKDKAWNYFKPNGVLATGWCFIKETNTWSMFDGKGKMMTGWYLDFETHSWYYLNKDGSMAYNTWIGNYYVNASGAWTKTK